MAGLRDKLMEPKAAAEAMKAYADETNRLNRERRASGATDRMRELEARLGTVLEWAGGGAKKGATDTPKIGLSVSVVAGAGSSPSRCPAPRRGDSMPRPWPTTGGPRPSPRRPSMRTG